MARECPTGGGGGGGGGGKQFFVCSNVSANVFLCLDNLSNCVQLAFSFSELLFYSVQDCQNYGLIHQKKYHIYLIATISFMCNS